MSGVIYSRQTVQNIAESVGISLKDEVANVLVADVEYRLRELIHEATKFMLHAKRSRLSADDINLAARVKNVEPVYGYSSYSPYLWRTTHFTGGGGGAASGTSSSSAAASAAAGGGGGGGAPANLYFLDDQEIDLDDIIYQPLPAVPLDVMYTAHWLSVEGVQPSIPQNPSDAEIALLKAEIAAASSLHKATAAELTDVMNKAAAGGGGGDASSSAATSKTANIAYQPQKSFIQSTTTSTPSGSSSAPPAPLPTAPVKTVLSKELLLYFEKITEAIIPTLPAAADLVRRQQQAISGGGGTLGEVELRNLAIDSLGRDPGLQPLLPYFVQYITDNVTKNLRNLPILWHMMRLTRSLFVNPNLFVEAYLHQFIPSILTCTISSKLSQTDTQDHWSLRSFSAQLLSHIITKYAASYHTLLPRLTKTLLRTFLDPLKGRGSLFGAIVGLGAMGEEVVKVLMLPNIKAIGQQVLANDLKEADKSFSLEKKKNAMTTDGDGDHDMTITINGGSGVGGDASLSSSSTTTTTTTTSSPDVKKMEAEKCVEALLRVIVPVIKQELSSSTSNQQQSQKSLSTKASASGVVVPPVDEMRMEYGDLLGEAIWTKLKEQ